MNIDEFSQKIESLRGCYLRLLQRNSSTTPPQDLLTEAFDQLHIALEELELAEEELRKQNDELREQNDELREHNEELGEQNEELGEQNEELAFARAAAIGERQRYQELFDFAPDGYLVTDMDGTIREANRAAAGLLNVEQKFLIDRSLFTFIVESERLIFHSELTQPRQGDWVRDWEVRLSPRRRAPVDVAVTVAVVRNKGEHKPIALRWLLRNITERKQVEEQLLHNAFHDALTGLPNRALFVNRLEHAVAYAKRHEDYLFAVVFLDLDRFKVINDSLGHLFGDKLLIGIASRLKACLRPTDTFARLGGDEFTILLENIQDVGDAIRVADRVQAELTLPFNIGGQEVFTTASIGIALSTTGYNQPEEVLRDADIAMYRAKALGKARYELFNTAMHARAVVRLQLETDLRLAVERQEFRLQYQPIVLLETGRITGFETLVRWQHPRHGLVSPSEFISVAEETGIIIPISLWVLREACRQTRKWQEQFPDQPELAISVNLCCQDFIQPNLLEQISKVLQETSLDASRLKLEVTESAIMENGESVIAILTSLHKMGIQSYIDDFGTGYSSLGRLHNFPISALKIDRSFVGRIGIEAGNLEIAETIVTLGQKLGVDVIAEGVETVEQLIQLKALKCKYGQGYFFSKPLDQQAAEALIRENAVVVNHSSTCTQAALING